MIIRNKEFTQIKSHLKYFISRDSQVFTTIKKRILKPGRNSAGYQQVWLIDNEGNARWERLHVLNALTFVPNPDNLPEVNHNDGNKDNNNDWNLSWTDRQGNQQHAHATGLMPSRKGRSNGYKHSEETKNGMSINKIGKKHPRYTGDYITPKGRFNSANAAGKANDVNGKTIQHRCKNPTWLHLGYDFIPKK